jgi:hypothetical protein
MDDVQLTIELQALLDTLPQVYSQLIASKGKEQWQKFQLDVFETDLAEACRRHSESNGLQYTEKSLQRDVKLNPEWQSLKKEVLRQSEQVEALELRREEWNRKKEVLLAMVKMRQN